MAHSEQNQRPIAVFDIDGVIRDVAGSYRRALADTVEQFTQGAWRPTMEDIDALKAEGLWNNDWKASEELIYRHLEAQGQPRSQVELDYEELVAFFQERYRGTHWSGYIRDEPLLVSAEYFQDLTSAGIPWGFFSGATQGSARYVLEQRLGLQAPVLVAMEDAPSKPDPSGLLTAVQQLAGGDPAQSCVIYVGDTVADMQTVLRARQVAPQQVWVGVGVIPPHVRSREEYAAQLRQAGAEVVLEALPELTPAILEQLSQT
jgi:HAD superfamily phosphatase